jgi:single-strand DNA-binding protein
MSKSVNQVILMGRLTKDVDLRTTASGKNVADFTLAVDKLGKEEGADFFDVTAWEKLADLMQQYTSKGSKVLVMGRMQQQTWEDKESGKKRSKVVVTANDVTFLDPKQSGGQTQDVVPEDVDDKPIDLSEIPF